MLGPYIKFRGTRGTKMSANADLSTMETYYNKMKQFENQFFIYGAKCTKMYILGYSSIIRLRPVLPIGYPLTNIYVHVKYGSNLIRMF